MPLFRLIAIAPAIFLLMSCAVTEPSQYSEQEPPQPTIIFVDASMMPQHMPNMVAAANRVYPRATSRAASLATADHSRNQAYLTNASANTSAKGVPIYWSQHIVQKGDTAYSLGQRYCSRTEDIKTYNDLNNAYSLKVGDSLMLPRTTC